MTIKIPAPFSGGLLLSYKCTAQCRHCMYACGPRWKAGPCSPPFLRNWHNHFDNYSNFIPGYCGGITLGDCRELDDLLKTGINLKEYPVLKYLISDDMRGLLQFALDSGYDENKDGYYSKCHLCVDIRKYLKTKDDFRELKPDAFYANLD